MSDQRSCACCGVSQGAPLPSKRAMLKSISTNVLRDLRAGKFGRACMFHRVFEYLESAPADDFDGSPLELMEVDTGRVDAEVLCQACSAVFEAAAA